MHSIFVFCGSGAHRDLHSFPTRRSSDLARVFVPDIKVMDNCSGLESVKAVLHDRAGNFERKVELKLTDTEIVNIGGGDRCTIYTYSHLSDPFYIPFEGCDVEPLEIVYNAFDGCNNSYWRK